MPLHKRILVSHLKCEGRRLTHVFPLVGSIRVSPGFILPLFSASSIIRNAMRSLTLPPAFMYSSFAYTVASIPRDCGILFNRTMGVLPMISVTEFLTPLATGGGGVMIEFPQ